MFAVDAPIECAMYAVEKNLLRTKGWTRFRKYAKQNGLLKETDEHNGDENNNWLNNWLVTCITICTFAVACVAIYNIPFTRNTCNSDITNTLYDIILYEACGKKLRSSCFQINSGQTSAIIPISPYDRE